MLEVDADLGSEDERVGDAAGAAGPDDVLKVRLHVDRASGKSEAISQFHRCLVFLHSNCWIQHLRPLLRILQVLAEVTEDNAQAGHIHRPRWEDAARHKSGGTKVWHLTD